MRVRMGYDVHLSLIHILRKGVFATRSPFRPNSIGLSCVKLEKVALDEPDSPVLYVEGADLMNGTPIFDIKPYIPYADCHPEATGSFTEYSKDHHLKVEFPQELLERIPGESREALIAVLADDPRPAYQNDPERSYGCLLYTSAIKNFQKEEGLTIDGIAGNEVWRKIDILMLNKVIEDD